MNSNTTPYKADGLEHLVEGVYMERSLADFARACGVLIEDEQTKLSPDTALIALLCDAVRLTREMTLQADRLCEATARPLPVVEHPPHLTADGDYACAHPGCPHGLRQHDAIGKTGTCCRQCPDRHTFVRALPPPSAVQWDYTAEQLRAALGKPVQAPPLVVDEQEAVGLGLPAGGYILVHQETPAALRISQALQELIDRNTLRFRMRLETR